MPSLTIDGKRITVKSGTTIMNAAEQLGIVVPHYCYHKALSIAGNCRMCMVEVEGQSKPVISCKTECQEGMVVHTSSENVKKLREAVLEFLLINHPLDCPICDQAGECALQNYYMTYGLYGSRLKEEKVKKSKAVSLGNTLMLDSERCVLCSRCVRFLDEVTETRELGIFNRADRSEIGIFPGKTLNNPYSGNLADICPVGALTDKDFRFKCRVWYLKNQASICPGCSRGCNIRIDFNLDRPQHGGGKRVMRLKPRENQAVNQWWLCDEGRYGYKFVDENRISDVFVRREDVLVRTSWEEGMKMLSAYLDKKREDKKQKEVGILASTHLTNEDLFAVRHYFKDTLGFSVIDYRLPVPDGEADEFLRTSDKSPNTRGAEEILAPIALEENEIIFKARKGQIKALVVFGYDLREIYGEDTCRELAEKLELLVFIGSNRNGSLDYARLVFPSTVFAEKEGTFTNCEGRVQRLNAAFSPLGEARPEWELIQKLALSLGAESVFRNPEELFLKLASLSPGFKNLTYEALGREGALLAKKK